MKQPYRRTMLALLPVALAFPVSTLGTDAESLYDANCKACHSIAGVGGTMAAVGGPLDGVGSKRDADWLMAYLEDPKSKIPDAKMPKMDLGDANWKLLTEYVLSLE